MITAVALLEELALPLLGWREWVLFPELHLSAVKAKIDTGARTSALHASEIEVVSRGRSRIVRFQYHPSHKYPERTEFAEATVLEERIIKSSTGHTELRPVIVTPVKIGEEIWDIEMTLSERHEMGFRVLIGREAIRGRFCVDPGSSYLAGPRPRRKKSPPKEAAS